MNVRLVGVDELVKFIQSLPRGMKIAGMRAVAEYIVGNDAHGLRHEPFYKYVSRKSAYGVTFVSEKQRRWFWANGGPDMIGNNRTHRLKNAWDYTETNSDWNTVKIINQTPYAGYVMGNQQARQPAKVGWRKAIRVVQSNLVGAIKYAQAEVNKMLARKGKVS